jgi:cation diffusion facilitator CzcD-associated flavoprotein CzcO
VSGLQLNPARWPQMPVDFTGKRIGIAGTGATAIQAIPDSAKKTKRLSRCDSPTVDSRQTGFNRNVEGRQ